MVENDLRVTIYAAIFTAAKMNAGTLLSTVGWSFQTCFKGLARHITVGGLVGAMLWLGLYGQSKYFMSRQLSRGLSQTTSTATIQPTEVLVARR